MNLTLIPICLGEEKTFWFKHREICSVRSNKKYVTFKRTEFGNFCSFTYWKQKRWGLGKSPSSKLYHD